MEKKEKKKSFFCLGEEKATKPRLTENIIVLYKYIRGISSREFRQKKELLKICKITFYVKE